MTRQLQDSFVEHGIAVDVDMLRHRELRGGADAGLLAEVQEGLHAAGAVVALGVDRGDVVVARLEDQVHHDAGLEVKLCQYFDTAKIILLLPGNSHWEPRGKSIRILTCRCKKSRGKR